ncbi:MAG: alpha/beta hydrolase [Pacificimonas sp.]
MRVDSGDKVEDAAERLIELLYAAPEQPERYDELMGLWASHLAATGGEPSARVSPHMERALRLFDILETQRQADGDDAVRILAAMLPGPGIVLTHELEVLALNHHAAAIVGNDHGEVMLAIGAPAHRRLQNWLADGASGGLLYLSGGGRFPAGANLLASVVKLKSGTVVLLASTDMTIGAREVAALKHSFRLSDAEADVAAAVGEGHSVAEVAQLRGVSELTIRKQLRSIFAKSGADGLTGLVRLVCGIAASHALKISGGTRTAGGDAIRAKNMTLPDGRSLSWLDIGDPNGRPALMFHSMVLDGTPTTSFAAGLANTGWRFVVPARGGVRGSDPVSPAAPAEMAARAATDAAALLSHLGAGKALILGQAAGSIYAATFASMFAERTSGLLHIGHAPFWREELMMRLPPRQRLIAHMTRRAPGALRIAVRAGCASINAGREASFQSILYGKSAADRAALADDDVRAAAAQSLRAISAQGGRGFVDDCPLIFQDWTDGMAQLTMPQHVIYGGQDDVAGAPYAEGYAAAVPQTTVECVEAAGQLLFLSHWTHVLAAMEKLDAAPVDVAA